MEKFYELLKKSCFFVEANSFEYHSLWRTWSVSTVWKEIPQGGLKEIGCIEGNPQLSVWVEFRFAELYGQTICFYCVSGRYADHTLVEDYLKQNFVPKYDDGTRFAMTDAMNFGQAVIFSENKSKELPKVVEH
jgi:hypothetical protein